MNNLSIDQLQRRLTRVSHRSSARDGGEAREYRARTGKWSEVNLQYVEVIFQAQRRRHEAIRRHSPARRGIGEKSGLKGQRSNKES